MSRFRNAESGVVVNVADHKDGRFSEGWVFADSQPLATPEPKRPAGRPRKVDN